MRGGKRTGAGRKSDGQERKIYSVRVSDTERQAIKELLHRMRTTTQATFNTQDSGQCGISLETALARYTSLIKDLVYFCRDKKTGRNEHLFEVRREQAIIYAEMLGRNLMADLRQEDASIAWAKTWQEIEAEIKAEILSGKVVTK